MSWDLAVWDGERPDPDAAGEHFEELMEAYEEAVESDHPPAPTEALRAFLDALAQRLPDDPNIEPPQNPWAYMPISDEASGPVAILHVVWDSVDTVREVVPALAREHGLVCYDMQDDSLL